MFRGRGGARPRSARFRQAVVLSNRIRAAARREHQARAKAAGVAHALSQITLSRSDESRLAESGAPRSEPHRRLDEDATDEGIVRAGFASDDAQARLCTGLGERTAQRARIICAEALVQCQEKALREVMQRPGGSFCTLKRSFDETPFRLRDDDGAITSHKLLHQRCFLRWSREAASRVVFPAVELVAGTGPGQLEALERVSESLTLESLRNAAGRVDVFAHICVGDSSRANRLTNAMLAAELPNLLHWTQRCDSHACWWHTLRPMENMSLVDPLFCFARLLKVKTVRQRLASAMVAIAKKDVASNTHVCIPPPDEAVARQRAVFGNTLGVLVRWCDELPEHDESIRLRSLSKSIQTAIPTWKQMLNGLKSGGNKLCHYCWASGGGRCCRDALDVSTKVEVAVKEVIVGALLAGTPDPTKTRWFVCSAMLRSVTLAVVCGNLLPRAW